MIIAHRGYAKNFKENTIAAFDAALIAGADAIETDVRLTRDNHVVISHDDEVSIDGKNIIISKTPIDEIIRIRGGSQERLLTLEEVFEYINEKSVPLFLELKQGSQALLELVVEIIRKYNLWETVHVIGIKDRIKTALNSQSRYPKLKVCQILMFPPLSFIKKPKKSYAVFLGWLKGIRYSEQAFKSMVPKIMLKHLKKLYESNGFVVMGGVLNCKKDIKYFHEAGISDIFTDEVEIAMSFYG